MFVTLSHEFSKSQIDTLIGSGSQVVPAVIDDVKSLTQIIRVGSPLSKPDPLILTCHLILQ